MRLLILVILMGFPLLEGAVLYELAAGPTGHGGWVLAWLVFAAIAGVVLIKQARFHSSRASPRRSRRDNFRWLRSSIVFAPFLPVCC